MRDAQNYLEDTHAHARARASRQADLFLTLIRQLAHVGRHGHVEHVVDCRVHVVSSLDVVLAVGLVTLLVAAVLQAVTLQVLERGRAVWWRWWTWGRWSKKEIKMSISCRVGSLVFLSLSLIFINPCPLCLLTLKVKERQTHSTLGVVGGVDVT